MSQVAQFIDILLAVLLAGTIGLIAFKALDLWRPGLLGRPSVATRLGATELELDAGLELLEGWMTPLAVIAATAPFIGLVGTVIHIMDALRALGTVGAELSVISGPVVTALNATLVGLASAIPAAAAHSLMQRKLQVLENQQRRALAAAR